MLGDAADDTYAAPVECAGTTLECRFQSPQFDCFQWAGADALSTGGARLRFNDVGLLVPVDRDFELFR